MSLNEGEIVSQDLSPNAGILGTQIADKTIEARNLADGVIPTSAIVDGNNIFIINTVLSAPFNFTSGGGATTGTVTINHNLGYIPIVSSQVNITNNQISAGQVGTFELPYLLLGTGGGTTNVFIILAFVKLLSINTSSMVFEVGAEGVSQNLTGTITVYILQETGT